jgi:hypothetical protein
VYPEFEAREIINVGVGKFDSFILKYFKIIFLLYFLNINLSQLFKIIHLKYIKFNKKNRLKFNSKYPVVIVF